MKTVVPYAFEVPTKAYFNGKKTLKDLKEDYFSSVIFLHL
jgi:hypothetical protein